MIRILHGDAREALATLPEASVQCCVTSPPYYGLRDYGTAQWEGGDPACDHQRRNTTHHGLASVAAAHGHASKADQLAKYECPHCGARRIDQQLGLEQTPAEYVAALVAVFREVRRVLRDDGVVFLNLGDSYCSTAPGTMGDPIHQHGIFAGVSNRRSDASRKYRPQTPTGLKPKDLIGIPWRVAFALQADGWWLRQDNVWAKPNPMPESVTDRTTRSHEYVFHFSKSATYFYDQDAIREKPTGRTDPITSFGNVPDRQDQDSRYQLDGLKGANRRSVWEISTQPFPSAHFATMPEQLATICILAGSRPGDMVLDPFGGAGTTGAVAYRLGRTATLIELNPAYCKMAERRVAAETPPLPFLDAAQ